MIRRPQGRGVVVKEQARGIGVAAPEVEINEALGSCRGEQGVVESLRSALEMEGVTLCARQVERCDVEIRIHQIRA